MWKSYILFKILKKYKILFYRTVCSQRTSLIQPSMFTGLGRWESTGVPVVANAGILLSTVLNVHLPCQLTVSCTCGKAILKIYIVSAILRGTVTTSTKGRCAWDSGSVIARVMEEVLTPTQGIDQCPGSLLKKFLNLRLRPPSKTGFFLQELVEDGYKKIPERDWYLAHLILQVVRVWANSISYYSCDYNCNYNCFYKK